MVRVSWHHVFSGNNSKATHSDHRILKFVDTHDGLQGAVDDYAVNRGGWYWAAGDYHTAVADQQRDN